MNKQAEITLSKLSFHLNAGSQPACRSCAVSWSLQRMVPLNGHCPDTTSLPGAQYLDPSLFETALRDALPLGLKAVTLTGGEPFAHPHIDRLLDPLADKHLAITLETTGSGLTVDRAARLAALNCQVVISLYGADPSTHDSLTGSPGGFQAAIQSIDDLTAAGLQPQIIFVLTRQNATQITNMVCLAESLNASSVYFHLIQPLADRINQALMVEELIALGRRIDREIVPYTRLHILYDQPPAFRGLNPQSVAEPQVSCSVLSSMSILEGGQVALCGATLAIPELILGQVGLEPLDEIWHNHPVLHFLRENLPDQLQGVCGRCLFKTACLGHCVAQNYAKTGSFLGPYWFCADAEQAGLFPASRLSENTVR